MILNTEPFEQTRSFDCGISSVKIILNYYGIKSNYQKMLKMVPDIKNGSSTEELQALLKHFGIESNYIELGSLEKLKKYIDKGMPVIVSWFSTDAEGNSNHWSVVRGINSRYVFLSDPGTGTNRKLTRKVFRELWFTVDAEAPTKPYKKTPTAYIGMREMLIPIPPQSKDK